MQRIYLAGPDVFLADAPALGAAKRSLCADYGFEGVFPLDNDEDADLPGSGRLRAMAIFRGNVALMDGCDLTIAQLTPFRGPHADVGTAFELGYMVAQGKPVYAYSNRAAPLVQRVAEAQGAAPRRRDNGLWDAEGLAVEDFGLADNLMLEGAVEAGGGLIVRDVPEARVYSDLAGFEDCLRRARARLPGAV